jgi:hypothetical protein
MTVARAAAAAVLALLATAAPARSETVLQLGHGGEPSAVTDAAGTLHVVWRDVTAPRVPLYYCRVPAGGSGCTPAILADWATRPHLLLRPQDGALIAVYGSTDDTTRAVVSGDGGTTWSVPAPVGTGLGEVHDAELSPDGGFVDTVHDAVEMSFQRVPLGGGVESRVVPLGQHRSTLWPRVTHLPDGRPAVIAQYALGRLGARVPAAGADPENAAAWSPFNAWNGLRKSGASDVDAGPTGTWLVATDDPATPRGNYLVRIWRWGARGFARPRAIGALAHRASQVLGAGAATPFGAALDVDAAGRLHAAWPLRPEDCGGQHCFVYRRTDRRGFGPPVVYPAGSAFGDQDERFGIAANSGGSGWLVWATLYQQVRAVPLVTPPRGSRVGSVRIGRRRVTAPDFYGCVPSGGTFTHRLIVDGRRGARIVSVRLFIDAGQPSRTDRRAPYRARFRLGFAPGTRHVAAAIVRYRLAGRHALRTARIGRTFVMC